MALILIFKAALKTHHFLTQLHNWQEDLHPDPVVFNAWISLVSHMGCCLEVPPGKEQELKERRAEQRWAGVCAWTLRKLKLAHVLWRAGNFFRRFCCLHQGSGREAKREAKEREAKEGTWRKLGRYCWFLICTRGMDMYGPRLHCSGHFFGDMVDLPWGMTWSNIWMFLVDLWHVYSWMDLQTNLKLGPPCKTLAHEIKCDQVRMRAALFSLLGQDFQARKPRCTTISCGLRTQVTQPQHPSHYLHDLTRWNWLYNIPNFGLIQSTFKSNTGPFPSLPLFNSWLVAVKNLNYCISFCWFSICFFVLFG